MEKNITNIYYKHLLIKVIRNFNLNYCNLFGILSILSLLNCSNSDEEWKKADRLIPMKEYSEDDAREWEDIKEEHIPVLRKSRNNGEDALLIELPRYTSSYNHYVESFGVLDEKDLLLYSISNERSNNPRRYGYIPWEQIRGKKNLRAFIKCNLHDTWIKEFQPDSLEN